MSTRGHSELSCTPHVVSSSYVRACLAERRSLDRSHFCHTRSLRLRCSADVCGGRHGGRGPGRARRSLGRVAQGGALRTALRWRRVASPLAADAPRAQARKLEGEVDSKLAAFSKLGARAGPARRTRAPRLSRHGGAGGDKPAALLGDGSDQVRSTDTPRASHRASSLLRSLRRAAQLVAARGEEIEALLQRLSDVNDAMSRCVRLGARCVASR